MCPTAKDFFWILLENNIPFVLSFNLKDSEIFLYISEEIQDNVFIPLLERTRELDNIFCVCSVRERLPLSVRQERYFDAAYHLCTNHDTFICVIALKNGQLPYSLQIRSYRRKEPIKYFGIKNKKINLFNEDHCEYIMNTYLI